MAGGVPARWGLGFAGILALVGMLCSLAGTRLRWISALAAAAAAVATYGLAMHLNILVAIVLAVALSLALETKTPAAWH